jgi:hypothetical protein
MEGFELACRHDSSWGRIPYGDGRELGLVFAFVVGGSGHAGGAGSGSVRAGPFSESPGEVFGFLGARQP